MIFKTFTKVVESGLKVVSVPFHLSKRRKGIFCFSCLLGQCMLINMIASREIAKESKDGGIEHGTTSSIRQNR